MQLVKAGEGLGDKIRRSALSGWAYAVVKVRKEDFCPSLLNSILA